MADLVRYGSASVIRQKYPAIEDQYDYQQQAAALRSYFKDPELAVAEIEAQAALAGTVDEMRRQGELAGVGNPHGNSRTLRELLGITDTVANKAYARWSRVAAVPDADRAMFWATFKGKPSRAALLNWWRDRQREPRQGVVVPTVIHGDCLEVLPTLEPQFGTFVADPPYNVLDVDWDRVGTYNEYLEFLLKFLQAVQGVMLNGWVGFLFCSPSYFAHVEMVIEDAGLEVKSRIIWHHANMAKGRDTSARLISTWEPIFHIGPGKLQLPAKWGRDRFDVQTFAVPQTNFEDRKVHQAQKPLALVKWLVGLGAGPVLDPFAGGGTTGAAAIELGRESTLIEKDEGFVEVIHDRLA